MGWNDLYSLPQWRHTGPKAHRSARNFHGSPTILTEPQRPTVKPCWKSSLTYDFDHVILRPHNVYGPRQNISDPFRNVLGIWINRIMRGKPPIIYGDGKQSRAFSYIEDVTPAIANCGFYEKARGQIINVGSDEVASIEEACSQLLAAMNVRMQPLHEPARPGEVKHAYCTVQKSIELLDYRTKYPLKEGLEKMIKWAKSFGPQEPTYKVPLEITKKAPRVWVEKLM